jgi:hypothetical protein
MVSVGFDHLRLYSQTYTCIAILLDLLFTTISTLCLVLDPVTAILWDLACLVLVVMISGSAGVSRSASGLDSLHTLDRLHSLYVNVLKEVDDWRRAWQRCFRTCWGSRS